MGEINLTPLNREGDNNMPATEQKPALKKLTKQHSDKKKFNSDQVGAVSSTHMAASSLLNLNCLKLRIPDHPKTENYL